MAEKIRVCKASEIAEGTSRIVEAGGKQIAIFNVKGEFFAISNECAHQGGPLGEGYVSGETVTCPWHAWEYNLRTGKSETMPGAGVQTFPVTVKGDEIFVEI